ncbi:N-acyl-D-amino-acid deacylase family protein [Sphingosinicella rhizophila]|uniref:Amidohydrolase family protein n=1 Tax=Sphingosinicella rhizophila TaxID=3050082 RepID=A0ABU3QB67_9SPHN|nr:amidohydrolase family protein [Sphingosinicella sp. GR2756]MDT9600636.1 amidohydrolase family protein [Sphingosinicella sp. GR2756]
MKLLIAAVASLLASAAPAAAADYDIVIRGGRVLDGGGNPWVAADVAIKDGRIARVGQVPGAGAKEIDARGRYVSPGFIDMQDQSGRSLMENSGAESKLRQGVTSLIAGEGGTPVPADEIAGWFDSLEKNGIAVNFGTYYGAVQARSKVMGDRAGAPTPEQLEIMRQEVAKAMRAGVFGISTALIYAPATFQSAADLIELAQVAGRCNGFYVTHLRDESDKLLPAIQEAIEIGEKGGVKVEIYHLKAAFQPGWGKLMPQAVAAINAARARGVDIAADMYVYTAGGTGLNVTVPSWVWADGREKGLERLRDPAVRARIKKEVAAGSQADWSNLVVAAGGWDNVVLAGSYSPDYEQYEGKSIAYIGKQLKKDPADVAWDIVLAAQPNRASALYFMMSEKDIETALRQPWTSIGSDASASDRMTAEDGRGRAHPRAYGNFPRVIAEYVKKRQVLTLEEAVRKMSGWPAQRMGLSDRGLIREGMRADVIVFDLDKLQDTATFDRPVAAPTGIDDVIVNGVATIEAGKVTGARPGRVLRHPCNLPATAR